MRTNNRSTFFLKLETNYIGKRTQTLILNTKFDTNLQSPTRHSHTHASQGVNRRQREAGSH